MSNSAGGSVYSETCCIWETKRQGTYFLFRFVYLQFITGYFDTTSGSKLECQSYKTISEQIKEESRNITFFTDIPGG